jgi:hypothetical protein
VFHEINGLPRRCKTFTEESRVGHAACVNFGLAPQLIFFSSAKLCFDYGSDA